MASRIGGTDTQPENMHDMAALQKKSTVESRSAPSFKYDFFVNIFAPKQSMKCLDLVDEVFGDDNGNRFII